MGSDQPIDIVMEVINFLAEKPSSVEELSDKLWEKLHSPVATTPAIFAVVNFLARKKLIFKRRGIYGLSKEGKRVVAERKWALPTHVSYYHQILEVGRERRREVIRQVLAKT